MRPIDSDALEAQFHATKIIEVFPDWDNLSIQTKHNLIKYGKAVKGIVQSSPTVDAVEVVRCKDCHWAKPYERIDGANGYYCQNPKQTFQYGTNWERLFEPVKEVNDFCSYGKMRKDSADA